MRITFIFGNGFDVNLGLKTKYEHFYPTYLESCEMLPEDNCIKKFSQKMESDDYENWSDFEWAFSQNAEGSHQEIGEIIADFNDKFTDYLRMQCDKCNYDGIDDYMRKMADYILEPHSFLERNDKQKLQEYFKKHLPESYECNFVSLNYTDTLEKLLENNKYLPETHLGRSARYHNYYGKVLHLHGSIDEGYIIVGIDALEQFKNDAMKENRKLGRHCVKKIINEESGYIEKEESFDSIIRTSNVICVYGVAFGETDRSRWNVINEWLKKSKEHKLIIFKYNTQFERLNRMSKGQLLDAIDEARDEYLKILGFEGEFENMYDQIFVADSSKALNIKLIDCGEDKASA